MATYLDELVQKITTKADLKGFDDLDRKQRRAIKSNDLLAKSFRRAFGIFFGIQGIRSVIQTTRDLDLLRSSIEGLTKSTQDWEYLRKEAERTGTSFKTLAGAYKNFYSSANMAGFNKNQIQEMFSDVLTAGRGAGVSQQQMGMALLAMEQMLSKGKVSMEELRRQLGNAMPGAFELAAKAMGVTTEQLNELVKKGLDARVLLPKLTKEMKNYYMEAYLKNIHTLDAELIRLDNAWQDFQKSILQGEAGEALAQLVRDVTKILRSQTLLRFVQMIGKALAFIFKHIKLILLFFGVAKVIQYALAFKRLHLAILAAAKSTAALGAVNRTLAAGYAFLTNGEIITGLKMMKAGLWSLVAPTAALAAKFTLIIAAILMLQDILLTFADSEADTYTRDLMNFTKKVHEMPEANYDLPLHIDNKETRKLKKDIEDLKGGEMRDRYMEMHAPGHKFTPFAQITGGAAPIFNTDLQTPNSGVVGTLPNLNGNYSNSDTKSMNNNITINISAPNSQPDTIAQSVEDVLQNFFNKYELGFSS